MKRFGVILPLIVGLIACDSDPAPTAQGEVTVSGEVLEGTISDAMLPLDTIRSQSPRLSAQPSNAAGSAADETASSPETDSAPRADASTDEPLADPTATEPTPDE